MAGSWTPQQLEHLSGSHELEVAVAGVDGALRPWVTVWVVVAGDEAYVRTWHRRETGWFGRVLRSRRARVRAPGVEADVVVEDLGADLDVPGRPPGDAADVTDRVDAAYRDKYGRAGDDGVAGMVTDEARTTTLRLTPIPP